MCGVFADKAAVDASNQAGGSGLIIEKRTWSALRAPSGTGFRKTTAVISTVLLASTVSYVTFRGRSIEKEPIAPSVGATAPEPNLQQASAPPSGSEESSAEVENFSSVRPRLPGTSKTKDDNPIELWSRVRRGSTEAEVDLAELYLQGITLDRSCEQAHVLLSAASRKRSKAADSLLAGAYARQCQ